MARDIMTFRLSTTLLFLMLLVVCSAWDNEELELFDLVEEINQNFYELFGVDQAAKSSEIRKAYKRLSLQLHPDKNKAEDAGEKFRQMVAVYEVLKDENRRKQYDLVLQNGLPDWRMPVYYYRRVRKMGLLELALLLFIILSTGHYLVVWSIYLEKKFTMEELFTSVRKKKEKKAKKNKAEVEEEMDELLKEELQQLPRPQFKDILPFQCVRLVIHVIVSLPSYYGACRDYVVELRARQKERALEKEEEEAEEITEVVKKPKRRKKVELPEYSPELYEQSNVVSYSPLDDTKQEDEKQIIKTGEWTDEELGLLAKAVAKFPGGTSQRWEKVAEMVGRTPSEVISKSKSLKGSYLLTVSPQAQGLTGISDKPVKFKGGRSISDDIISTNTEVEFTDNDNGAEPEVREKNSGTALKNSAKVVIVKSGQQNVSNCSQSSSHGNKTSSEENQPDSWTQNQQMILEWALKQYPKGTDQRWERIADHIPGKTKEDCVSRFKYLAELVRKRKTASKQ
ncbi:dnaJ homolog subfamily C member 1-like [Liolophura sinensis]|uniref:dnaJ homolog subfamily C member 1-like n=1 Tax=Liolophura sinensis TaxID=3198878 RepID=UPI0031583AC4